MTMTCLSIYTYIVPGPIVGLTFTKISATVLQISWNSPEVTNGDIQFYSVMVETRTDLVFQENVPGEQRTILVTSLGKTVNTLLLIMDYINHLELIALQTSTFLIMCR